MKELANMKTFSVVQYYNNWTKSRSFKSRYANKNDSTIIVPFLTGLDADFVIVDNQVLVKSTDELTIKLTKMKFFELIEIVGKNSINANAIEFTNALPFNIRLYNQEYNMELHLIDNDEDWKLAKSAAIITNDLKLHSDDMVNNFKKVHKSLLKISKN
jgi:hypothetical protein